MARTLKISSSRRAAKASVGTDRWRYSQWVEGERGEALFGQPARREEGGARETPRTDA